MNETIKEIAKQIKEMFPNLPQEQIDDMAQKYFIEKMIEKANNTSEEQMRRDIEQDRMRRS